MSNPLIKVSPVPGRRVRDPGGDGCPVIKAGWPVDPTEPYWFRRIRDGDVTVDPPDPAEVPAPAQAAAADPLAEAETALQAATVDLAAARANRSNS